MAGPKALAGMQPVTGRMPAMKKPPMPKQIRKKGGPKKVMRKGY